MGLIPIVVMRTLLMCLCCLGICPAQAQLLVNCSGLSDGYHIQYLDKKFTPTSDTDKAIFSRYVYCDGEQMTLPFIPNLRRFTIDYKPLAGQQGGHGPLLLNDTVFFLRPNGRVRCVEVYADGYPISSTDYRDDGNTVHVYLDYSKHCQDQPESYYFEVSDLHGTRYMTGYFRRDAKGRLGYLAGCD